MQIRCVLGQRQLLYFLTSQLGYVERGINEDKQPRSQDTHSCMHIHSFFSIRTVAVTLGHLQVQNHLSGS